MGDFDIGMIPFRDQLVDYPAIKAMLLKPQKNPAQLKGVGMPWRVYAQKEVGGRWRKRDFKRYKDAFEFLKPRLKTYHDISITSKRLRFPPPGRVVKIRRHGEPLMQKTKHGSVQVTRLVRVTPPPGHSWCIYCRRFTVFIWFTSHHAFTGSSLDHSIPTRRCCVCGIREVTGAWRH